MLVAGRGAGRHVESFRASSAPHMSDESATARSASAPVARKSAPHFAVHNASTRTAPALFPGSHSLGLDLVDMRIAHTSGRPKVKTNNMKEILRGELPTLLLTLRTDLLTFFSALIPHGGRSITGDSYMEKR